MTDATLSRRDLHSGWTLEATGGDLPANIAGARVAAEVPGTTHTDLLRAGLIPDPYIDMNEKALEWMWTADWRYSTEFAADAPEEGERVDLAFDGLDTVATVSLNGTELGRTFNMHRSYRYDVRDLINGADNKLVVDFASAVNYAYEREAVLGDRPRPEASVEVVTRLIEEARANGVEDLPDIPKTRHYAHPFNTVRKMACSFGWDWGPDLQTAGMWKGVRLERWRTARLASVRPLVTVDGDTGRVEAHVEIERASDVPVTVVVACDGAEARAEIPAGQTAATVELDVPGVRRWWPHGYGEAALYDLAIDLHSGDTHLDTYAKRIGFRSIELDTSGDADGSGFTLVVNGERVFVKGANWIPDDHLMTRITRARLRRRILQARDAHMNLLRIWGGGIYETDDFYELCGELGIMVWQDFLFACAAYAEDDIQMAEVEAEARENITRLAPQPALVVYNGSNENVWGYFDWGWQQTLEGMEWGNKYYDEVLPAVLGELDTTRPYTPSSPYSTQTLDMDKHPNDPRWGTVHEWKVWNQIDYTHYRDYVPRFCSEFGFQGPATWSTIERTLPVDELHGDHPSWLLHQKATDGNGKLNRGMDPHLPNPKDSFEDWHWATSLNQARAIRYGIEHYRSHWPVCAGSIVWQLNDCWPVTSWAAIDGDERKKPLWYSLRQAYSPRLLTFQPRDADGGNDPAGALHLVAVNDTDQAWDETLTFTRMALDGTELAVATAHLAVEPRGAVTIEVPAHVTEAADATAEALVADAGYPGDDDHVRALHTFVEDKAVAYDAAPFDASAEAVDGGYRVTVRARGLVRDLTILADKVHPDAEVDDALVTLVDGDTHVFAVTCPAAVDPAAFLAPRVLVSVNSLVS